MKIPPHPRLTLLAAWLAGLVALAAAGCGEGKPKGGVQVPEGCNPLAANWDCLLPYPSDFYLVDDPTMPSGKRVAIPTSALPVTESGHSLEFQALHPADGWSLLPQILMLFPFPIDRENLVFHTDDVTLSQGPTSPTVLLRADTGERVLHFAEPDPRADSDARRGLLIRPMTRLQPRTRYIVAVRRLVQVGGVAVPPGEGFALLRDGKAAGHPALGPLVAHYESDVFGPLATAGIAREELQLAWDFTTGSMENLTRDLLRVRELTLLALETTPPAITVDEVYDDPFEHIFRRIQGTFTMPLFVEHERPGALLHRDGQGEVTQNGTVEVPFTVLIPSSVADATSVKAPGRVVQYGHGFFGLQNEAEGGFVRSFAHHVGAVIVAIDWWGMSTKDMAEVIEDILTDTSRSFRFVDRVHQGMANQIGVTYLVRSTLADVPGMSVGGVLAFDPDQVYFYGISQGHILGGTYLALSPHIDRGVLGSGGCSFPFMMFRSLNFNGFLSVIAMEVTDSLDQQKYTTLSAPSFERIDPVTYAPLVIDELLPGGPAERRVLMHTGVADAQVPNLASHVHARALGLTHLLPAPRPLVGLLAAEGPIVGSAIVEFDFNLPPPWPGLEATPAEDGNEVHEGLRRLAASMDQVDLFLRPGGVITNLCDGACDPE